MLKEKFISFMNGSISYGIDLTILPNEEIDFSFVELKKQKEELVIQNKHSGKGLNNLFKLKLNPNTPIYLNVKGKGVLQKQLETFKNETFLDSLNKALPNAKPEELYYYTSDFKQNKRWVQLVRKNILTSILEQFESKKLIVTNIHLGYISINSIAEFITEKEVTINGYKLKFEDQQLIEIEHQNKNERVLISIVDELVSNEFILAYAMSFIHFYRPAEKGLAEQFIDNNQSEQKQKKIFQLGVKTVLGFFLITLLLNFLLFQEYNSEYNTLKTKAEVNKSQINLLSELKVEKKKKEEFFIKTDLISASSSSFYSDRMAMSRPDGISWNELTINPSIGKLEKGNDVEFDINTIEIFGVTRSSSTLDEWIKELRKEEWINTIDIKNLQKLERKESSSFNLKITLN